MIGVARDGNVYLARDDATALALEGRSYAGPRYWFTTTLLGPSRRASAWIAAPDVDTARAMFLEAIGPAEHLGVKCGRAA